MGHVQACKLLVITELHAQPPKMMTWGPSRHRFFLANWLLATMFWSISVANVHFLILFGFIPCYSTNLSNRVYEGWRYSIPVKPHRKHINSCPGEGSCSQIGMDRGMLKNDDTPDRPWFVALPSHAVGLCITPSTLKLCHFITINPTVIL